MNANELLIHLMEDRLNYLFEAARQLPPDKLDWKASPNNRSALDMLQEVATAVPAFFDLFERRSMQWDQARFEEWVNERSQITDLGELERVCRENYAKLYDYIRTVDPADLTSPVELPFPGKFNLADVIAYHLWNAGYHEGQINFIADMFKQAE